MAVRHLIEDTGPREGDVLNQLVREQSLKRFAFFLLSGEGLIMPDGSEELSGHVVDEQGRVFSFWLSWDEERGTPVLSEWEQDEPEPHWLENIEYRRARELVGLSAR